MKQFWKYTFIIICTISIYSCKSRSTYDLLKPNCKNFIEQYIDNDSLKHISYMMMSANECIRNQASLSGYVIGPLYDNMWHSFKEERCHKVYSYKGKVVYLYTNLSDLIEFHAEKQPIRYCKRDSIPFMDSFSNDPSINFFKRAWIISINDNKISHKTDVDKLFLPVIIKDSIVSEE